MPFPTEPAPSSFITRIKVLFPVKKMLGTLFLGALTLHMLSGQPLHVGIEASHGVEAGWWVHNRGSDQPGISNNQGWDRSHLALVNSWNLGAHIKRDRWSIGLMASRSVLKDDELVSFNETGPIRIRIFIAEEYVRFWEYKGFVAYEWIHKRKLRVSPVLAIGTFIEDSTHPDKANFGLKYLIEPGFEIEGKITDHLKWWFRPHYSSLSIRLQNPSFEKEKHNIYSVGVYFGFRYWIRKL